MSPFPSVRAVLALALVLGAAVPAGAQARPSIRFDAPEARLALEPHARPIVTVTIDGHGPFRMLVETGSPNSHLNPLVFDRIVAGGGREPDAALGTVYRAARIPLGDAVLSGLPLVRGPQLPVAGIDGLLGLDAFAAATVTVDFPARALVLVPDTLPAANGRDVVPMVTRIGLLQVEVDAGGTRRPVLIDTQSAASISVANAFEASTATTTAPVTVGRASGPTVGDVPVRRARLAADLRIGDAVVTRPIIDFMPLSPVLPQEAWIVGLRVLREFALSIDQRTGRVRFARAARTVPAPPPERMLGAATAAQPDGTRRVAAIVPGFAAEAAGLQAGDVLLSIDGQPMQEVSELEWSRRVTSDRPMRLGLRRGGESRVLSVTPGLLGF